MRPKKSKRNLPQQPRAPHEETVPQIYQKKSFLEQVSRILRGRTVR